jgi:hypothetical protein
MRPDRQDRPTDRRYRSRRPPDPRSISRFLYVAVTVIAIPLLSVVIRALIQ